MAAASPRREPDHSLTQKQAWLDSAQELEGNELIILGLVLFVIGLITHVAILETLGLVIAVVGVALLLLGSMGRAVGGRRHYW